MLNLRDIDTAFIRILAALCILFFITMITAILAQIVMRYVFSSPLTWSEELARYSMIWLAMLASALCSRGSQHLALMGAEAMPPAWRLPLRVISTAVSLALLALLFWHACDLTIRAGRQVTSALGLPMSWMYAAMPVGFGAMIIGQILGLLAPAARALPQGGSVLQPS